MGRGNKERGYTQMKSLIKGYRRKKVGIQWSRGTEEQTTSVRTVSVQAKI
jgi:hypothetical protein